MANTPTRGRPAIFRGMSKEGHKVQGNLTPKGGRRFEEARRRLAKLVAWEVEEVSARDTIEFLVRGEAESLKEIEAARRV
jgi:uncharacterized hydantoinase/oxoprolinase family protein